MPKKYSVCPLTTGTIESVTETNPVELVAIKPCNVTVKGFDPNADSDYTRRPIIIRSPDASTGYPVSSGSTGTIAMNTGDRVFVYPSPADSNGLSISVIAERFPTYRQGEV